jgi:hypothetical protein
MTEFEIASQVLRSGLSVLSRWGFHFESEDVKRQSVFGERLLLHYFSDESGRAIRIYYSIAENGKPATLSVFVNLRKDEIFSFNDFLRERDGEPGVKLHVNADPVRPVKEFCERYVEVIRSICEDDLADLLSSESWSVKPFDWEGYK